MLSVERCSLGNTSLHRDEMTPPLQEYSRIQFNTIQYNTIQYNTIQYNTILYNTILFTLTATPELTVNRKCYQVLKPEIEFHMMNEIYGALPMRTHIQKRRHFFAKMTNANIYKYNRKYRHMYIILYPVCAYAAIYYEGRRLMNELLRRKMTRK